MKSKLDILLDDVTILNFKYILKLFRRYYVLTFFIPIIAALVSFYFYKGQNEIHSGSISFRYIPEVKDSPIAVLSSMTTENQNSNGLSPTEIVGIGKSVSFLQALAREIVEEGKYLDLNLNPIFARKKNTVKDFLSHCKKGDRECAHIFFRKRLPDFYSIQEDDEEINKYNIVVKTLNRYTTDTLVRHISNSIGAFRIGMIKFQVEEQVRVAEKLLNKESSRLDKLNLGKTLEEKKIIETNLDTIIKKIRTYNVVLSEKKVEYDQTKISLKYTKSTLGKKVTGKGGKDLRSLKKLLAKKELVIADITALEHSLGEGSSSEDLVLRELKKELVAINKKVSNLEKSKEGAFLTLFRDEKLKSKEAVEFNLKVLKDQIDSLTETLEELSRKKNIIIASLKEKEDFLEENRTIVDYKKLLEAKLLQLKLKEDTIVSDFAFDEYLSSSKRYKKYGLAVFIPFSIILTAFFMLFVIVIRYYFDKRIVDKEEFQVLFDDIPIVGDVPHYD